MNVPMILDLCKDHLDTMEDSFLKDHFSLKHAESITYFFDLINKRKYLEAEVVRLKWIEEGRVSPSLTSNSLVESAAKIAILENKLFFNSCDIAGFLLSQGLKHECLNI